MNPYPYPAVIENDEDYYRKDDLHIERILHAPLAVVLGLRRVGKSSFLNKCHRHLSKHLPGARGYMFTLQRGIRELRDELQSLFGLDPAPHDDRELLDAVSKHLDGTFVLMLDELECSVGSGLLESLLSWRYRDERIRLVLTTTPGVYDDLSDEEIPGARLLREHAVTHEIRPLLDNEAVSFLRRDQSPGTSPLSDAQIAQVLERYSRMPIELAAVADYVQRGIDLDQPGELMQLYDELLNLELYRNVEQHLRSGAVQALGKLQETIHDPDIMNLDLAAPEVCGSELLRLELDGLLLRNAEGRLRWASPFLLLALHSAQEQKRRVISASLAKPARFDKVVIHHISDLHFGPAQIPLDRYRPVQQRGETMKIKLYREYLEMMEERGLEDTLPHFILISGDLTTTGSATEMKEALEFVQGLEGFLREVPGISKDQQIIVVPGNHDLDWRHADLEMPAKERNSLEKKFSQFQLAFDRYINPFREEAGLYVPSANIIFYTFNSALYCGEPIPLPQAAGGKTASEFLKFAQREQAAHQELAKLSSAQESGNEELAARAWEEIAKIIRIDSGYVDEDDLRAFNRWVGKCRHDRSRPQARHALGIAVCHHNVDYFPNQEWGTYDFVNAYQFKEYLLEGDFRVVLHGHQHRPMVFSQTYGKYFKQARALFAVGVGSLGALPHEANGFNVLVVDRPEKNDQSWSLELREFPLGELSPSRALPIRLPYGENG